MLPVLGKKAVLEWCMKEGLIGSSYVCPKCGESMELRERTAVDRQDEEEATPGVGSLHSDSVSRSYTRALGDGLRNSEPSQTTKRHLSWQCDIVKGSVNSHAANCQKTFYFLG
ncbi:hypothetical protein TNCV_1654351 [Trichonephila clavipes]|nr:hypothetical protein TNCV_1654351 [Trichonephila clavipes]